MCCLPGLNCFFLNELSEFLSPNMKLTRLVIARDFKIHFNNDSDLVAPGFISVISSSNFTKHVSGPMNISKNTCCAFVFFNFGFKIDSIGSEDIFNF